MKTDCFSDDECQALLLGLLHDERDLQTALAPDGLDRSPLHLFLGAAERGERHRWLSLIGTTLWEVFSNNHNVRSHDGRLYDLGSWRGSGGFIAGLFNTHYASGLDHPLDYLDFYCGFSLFGGPVADKEKTPGAADEALRPLFRFVFGGLRARGCTWTYAPPALHLVRLTSPHPAEDPASYDPARAAREALEEQRRDAQTGELEEQIAHSNAQAREHAEEHPPLIVRAYHEVYGSWPDYLDEG